MNLVNQIEFKFDVVVNWGIKNPKGMSFFFIYNFFYIGKAVFLKNQSKINKYMSLDSLNICGTKIGIKLIKFNRIWNEFEIYIF